MMLGCIAALAAPAQAQLDPKTCVIVYVHGKGAAPQQLAALSRKLQAVCPARLPEMPWSARRGETPAGDGLQELTTLVKNLRREGAKQVILLGLGLGANAALAYGAGKGDADGIIAIGGDASPNAQGWGNLPALAPRLPQGMPLLWIIGSNDPLKAQGETYAFTKAPPHPANRFYQAKSDANATPEAVTPPILEWLKSLE